MRHDREIIQRIRKLCERQSGASVREVRDSFTGAVRQVAVQQLRAAIEAGDLHEFSARSAGAIKAQVRIFASREAGEAWAAQPPEHQAASIKKRQAGLQCPSVDAVAPHWRAIGKNPEPVKVERVGHQYTHDPRFQCAPGERPFGAGFAAMGPGRYLEDARQ